MPNSVGELPRSRWRRRKLDIVPFADRARDARQWQLAAQLYREALDRDPWNPPIWVQYGHALKESGALRDPDKLAQAELAYRRALSLDPRGADTYLQLGHVLKLQGKSEEARGAYLRAFTFESSLDSASFELAQLGWSEVHFSELRGVSAGNIAHRPALSSADGASSEAIAYPSCAQASSRNPTTEAGERLAWLLPILRCPETGGHLALDAGGGSLVSQDGSRRWPIFLGRPLLFPGMDKPQVYPETHLSNPLPANALELMRSAQGPVLHLGAGGTVEQFEHVIEVEAAVFRHTDIVGDVHRLPFADGVFEAVIALNAFEHFRDPSLVAQEIFRVLRPGGRVLIRTAFLQPLHEAPWHFYNCTRYGLEIWFNDFETERLHVSDNFHAGYSIAWLASECEAALRDRLSGEAADSFAATPVGHLALLWRTPGARDGNQVWGDLAALPQDAQEIVAAGFEFLGRRPEVLTESLEKRRLDSNRKGEERSPAALPSPAHRSVGGLRLAYISGEPDFSPGHQYRIAHSAAAAETLGACTSWMRVDEIPGRLSEIHTASVLVIWRAPWDELLASAIDAARSGGAKIVFDIDDLMVDPELARLDVIDGIRTQWLTQEGVRAHYARVRQTMSAADLCVTTTEELASHMRRASMPTVVLPNGFDYTSLAVARLAARRRRSTGSGDGLVRIGYAGGSRTHQRDFALCAAAVAEILRTHPDCRLVAFRSVDGSLPYLDVEEFPELRGLESQIEWRNFVPHQRLPEEIARLDVNLAPLEVGNPFCEAKSELKFFEAALVDVPTIASPTGPFRRAIRHGETGFLAATPREWRDTLARFVDDAALRRCVAAAACRDVLWTFGPERRTEALSTIFDMLAGGQIAARAFELQLLRLRGLASPPHPHIPDHELVFEVDHLRLAQVTVVVPLYNYARFVIEALDSVAAQTLQELDLIVIDDRSTDDSLRVVLSWARANAARFNRIAVLQNRVNSGLGSTRNIGFDTAETPFVLTLDADNRLLPGCAAACLETIQTPGTAFAYPVIKRFGAVEESWMGVFGYDPVRLSNGNYIDAMALISKAAWVAVGGYDHVRTGWEDFDLWCNLAEHGFRGVRVPGEPLAEYRVHPDSMIEVRNHPDILRSMTDYLQKRHPWLTQSGSAIVTAFPQ
jgi:glycosyltransferase involved in cell wall biosynthesis